MLTKPHTLILLTTSVFLGARGSCNTAADCGSLPYEQFFLCFTLPLIVHRFLKGIPFYYILINWAMNTLLVLVSVIYSGHLENMWSVSHAFFFLYAIYRITTHNARD
jgi:hypothetical protein